MRGVSVGSRCLGGSTQARAAQPKLGICLSSRAAVRQPTPLQASRGQLLFSTSAPRPRSPAAEGPKTRGRRRAKLPAVATTAGALCAIAAAAWYSAGAGGDDSLNETKFTPFDIVAREQVSPTAFLLTVRSPAGPAAANAAKVQAAWDHGLWSVEVKQPQLQIARHYTPLPPLLAGEDAAAAPTAQLRFLVRRMPTGEMSNYLARLEVGDQLWLRGPHYGFDVARRLGSADDVVFLAGGTGVAPALQLAHKLLGAPDHQTTTTAGGPSLHILWANRQGVDAVAREPLSGATAGPDTIPGQSVLLRQLAEMRRAYGDRLRVDYFVDEEKSFVGLKDVDAALGRPLAWRSRSALPPADKNCVWHSATLLALSADEEDRLRGDDDAACTCGPPAGRKIACVSGPDGFIEAYAGAKRWHAGRELQGPVQGVIGTVKRQSSGAMGDWLVLKL